MSNYEDWKRNEALKSLRRRAKAKRQRKKVNPPSKSVRTVSGGLPSLGKRR